MNLRSFPKEHPRVALQSGRVAKHMRGNAVAAPQNYLAVIKVVGIGGGGVNAVNR
ncbi:MAG: hypothetical protein JWQ15_929, partial [Marmoricola sp.]|nr:hypothetical protein [Marmoricola sp.]